ncbi:MAG: glycosyltransferase [Xanthobacteraceae bacterium]
MLSVIIGTLNNERPLVRTLAALVPAAAAGVIREVVIADAGSSDATLEVADIAGCDVIAGKGPLADQLRTAAAKARADWLMFLQPGTILEPAWADEATQFVQQIDLFADDRHRAASFRRGANMGSRSMFAEAMGLLRASLTGRVDAAQGLVIARRHYEQIGGHRAASDPENDLLRRLGRRDLVVLRSGAAMRSDA